MEKENTKKVDAKKFNSKKENKEKEITDSEEFDVIDVVEKVEKLSIGFEVKDIIEGDYKGKGKWYPGKIMRKNRNSTYDIDYDDGECEKNVLETRIRFLEEISASKAASPAAKATPSVPTKSPADKVATKSPAPAAAEKVKEETTKEKGLQEGDQCEADWKGKGAWCPGIISCDRLDGTYNVLYDDGDKEFRVPAARVRKIEKVPVNIPKETVTDTSTNLFKEGDKVEADWKGKGSWCPGVISCDREDGTYNVEYDDGDKEYKVIATRIRLLDWKEEEETKEPPKGKEVAKVIVKAGVKESIKAKEVVTEAVKPKESSMKEREVVKEKEREVVKVPSKKEDETRKPDPAPVKKVAIEEKPTPTSKPTAPAPVRGEEKGTPTSATKGPVAIAIVKAAAEAKKLDTKIVTSVPSPIRPSGSGPPTTEKAKETKESAADKEDRESVEEISAYLRDSGGLAASAAKRSAEAAVGRDIISVTHLQRMLKVVNFSLESIHLTKTQADRLLGSLKSPSVSPAKPSAPTRPLAAPAGRK
jgi:hypothetical protein